MTVSANDEQFSAPVLIIAYNRPGHLKETIETLQANEGAAQSVIYICSDGPKTDKDTENVEQVRTYIHGIVGFKELHIIEREINYGLARNITESVTDIIDRYGKIIVIEDDIITSKYFLRFMNNALNRYDTEPRVMAISGNVAPLREKKLKDSFFLPWFGCWGWATWKDSWAYFEKDPQRMIREYSKKDIWRLNYYGTSKDSWEQVVENASGRLNTWAIFYAAAICKRNGLVLYPRYSYSRNTGFDGSGEHSSGVDVDDQSRFETRRDIVFPNRIEEDRVAVKAQMNYFRREKLLSPATRITKLLKKGGTRLLLQKLKQKLR